MIQAMISELRKKINSIPLIDNHAHNILQAYEPPDGLPREMIVSEATGSALKDSVYTLAHIRMLKCLARFLDLPIESSWEQITDASKTLDYVSFCQSLITRAGIQIILIDNGFSNDQCFEIPWHDNLTPFPNKRIVRIESLFEAIVKEEGSLNSTHVLSKFIEAINHHVNDPHVAGFKSIAAYRSGLDVKVIHSQDTEAALAVMRDISNANSPLSYKVLNHESVDWILNATLSTISGSKKPIQFHTGLGDNDISLVRADASLLQPLIKAYTDVPFVLLHSGYPYARQAGYLATVYSNVYLDFGLAIPLLSGDGQRSLVRQLLEICPTNKLLWSSDAALHPERYYLGAVQTKDVITEVLGDIINRQEIRVDEAVNIAKRILFENSNNLYNLNIPYQELDSKADLSNQNNNTNRTRETITSLSPIVTSLKSQDIKFIRLVWVDYVNLIRYRIIPIDHFASVIGCKIIQTPSSHTYEQLAESGISIAQAALGLVTNDGMAPGVRPTGDHDLKPDLSSMWKPSFALGHAYMMGRFFHKAHRGSEEYEKCPRTILQGVVRRAERDLGAKFLVGFETEFILLDRSDNPASTGAWSTARKLQCGPVTDCVHEIAQAIIDAGIKLELYHAESADGQYEVVTGPLEPVQAVDALIATREIIYNVAQKHHLRATLCPRLYSHQAGTASHVHISVQSPHSKTASGHPDILELPKDLASVIAGILAHLPAICAFTLPLDASYARVMDGVWSGGAWVCWGRENKETPLRLCGSGDGINVELKAFDGLANPYFGLAAVLAGGVSGLERGAVLEMRDCQVAASTLTEDQRSEMKIGTKMPTQNIVFEGENQETNGFVRHWLPDDAWTLYKSVRKFERDSLISEYAPAKDYRPTLDQLRRWSTKHSQKHY